MHRRTHEAIAVVQVRRRAREQARRVDEVELARVEEPVAQVGGHGDAEAAPDVGRRLAQHGLAFGVGREHRMRGGRVALDEWGQAGEDGVRGHRRQLQQSRHLSRMQRPPLRIDQSAGLR